MSALLYLTHKSFINLELIFTGESCADEELDHIVVEAEPLKRALAHLEGMPIPLRAQKSLFHVQSIRC